MLKYNMIVVEGCIHSHHMKIQMGTILVAILCVPVRGFILAAKEVGLCAALEQTPECERELLAFIYEEYHDEL